MGTVLFSIQSNAFSGIFDLRISLLLKISWHCIQQCGILQLYHLAETYWENSRRLQEAISDLKRQITFMD